MLDLTFKGRRLRASSAFKLVPMDKLPNRSVDRQHLKGHFGVFVPKDKTVAAEPGIPASTESALLYYSLRRPSELPFHLRSQLDIPLSDRIGNLILDGILEAEFDGVFLSGLQAIRQLRSDASSEKRNSTAKIARISELALSYGYRFCKAWMADTDEAVLPEVLTRKLYSFNAAPPSAAWRSRLTTDKEVLRYLRIDSIANKTTAKSGTNWSLLIAGKGGWWHSWQPTRAGIRSRDQSQTSHIWSGETKLYVSPTIEDLPDVLEACQATLFESKAVGLKVGCNLHGICRPDKLVAYFSSIDDLRESAALLEPSLSGFAAQGVPFSSQISSDGLLSWGSDTAVEESSHGEGGSSWRMWVSGILASALVDAGRKGRSLEQACEFAKTTAELSGIDTEQWRPKDHLLELTT